MINIHGWHASDKLFKLPSSPASFLLRTMDNSRHANGALGTWVTLSQDPQYKHDAYGKYLYEFEMLLRESQVLNMPIGNLSSLNGVLVCGTREEAEAEYLQMRDNWLRCGYKFVRVLEWNKVATVGIILDVFALKTWRCLNEH